MEERKNNVDATISWIERLFNFIKKAGIQNILITVMILFIVVVAGQAVFNPESLVKRFERIVNEQHTESVIKRLNNEPSIRQNLIALKAELNADRAYILETHNGGTNLAGFYMLT